MKNLLVFLIVNLLSLSALAADKNLIKSKDWRSDKLDSHAVSEKAACVASTTIKGKDTRLEVYSEIAEDGEYVAPVVQIVTTDVDPSLGARLKFTRGGKVLPLTISLNEVKTVKRERKDENGDTKIVDVEQQVFLGKMKNRKEFISLIKNKLHIDGTFFNDAGEVAKMKFSLRGSFKSVQKMEQVCL